MNFTSLGFRCQYNFVPSIFPKGKPTIKNIHESKEIQKLFQDLYKVTQQTINIWIALVQICMLMIKLHTYNIYYN